MVRTGRCFQSGSLFASRSSMARVYVLTAFFLLALINSYSHREHLSEMYPSTHTHLESISNM
jgi:hypothetical protein